MLRATFICLVCLLSPSMLLGIGSGDFTLNSKGGGVNGDIGNANVPAPHTYSAALPPNLLEIHGEAGSYWWPHWATSQALVTKAKSQSEAKIRSDWHIASDASGQCHVSSTAKKSGQVSIALHVSKSVSATHHAINGGQSKARANVGPNTHVLVLKYDASGQPPGNWFVARYIRNGTVLATNVFNQNAKQFNVNVSQAGYVSKDSDVSLESDASIDVWSHIAVSKIFAKAEIK